MSWFASFGRKSSNPKTHVVLWEETPPRMEDLSRMRNPSSGVAEDSSLSDSSSDFSGKYEAAGVDQA